MTAVFADTHFWVARINPLDQWHEQAVKVEDEIGLVRLVTTELVLVEVLGYFSGFRADTKGAAASVVRAIMRGEEIEVVRQTAELFSSGLDLYESRLDKGYSLTDCISMSVMRQRGVTDVLTHDGHFTQEGFNVLL